MCSVDSLRLLISDRLTAAAGEIFTEFEKTIVRYQEEIDRQRRLLDIVWKPHIPLQAIELPQSYVCKNVKTVVDHQPHDQERNSMVDHHDPEPLQIKDEQEELCASLEQSKPELPQIKKEEEEFCTILNQSNTELPLIKTEQEELCSSQQEEQLGLKPKTVNFVLTRAYDKNDHNYPKPNRNHLLFHISYAPESPEQERRKDVDSGSTGCVKLNPGHQSTSSHSNDTGNAPVSERQCDNEKAKKSRTCELCGKSFPQKSNLTRHQRTHTGERPYSCDICGKSFRQQIHVKSHMRCHTGEKPYVCSTCGKRFGDGCSLKVHMRSHTGEKPYSCKTCKKKFSHRGSWKTHMRCHTDEMPYSCNTCGKRFSRISTRHRHMAIHKKESHALVKHVEKPSVSGPI